MTSLTTTAHTPNGFATTTAVMLQSAIDDLATSVERISDSDIDRLVAWISAANHVAVFGCGREGLQINGFAMRLFHLGRSVSVVGSMTTPAIGPNDLLLLTVGPGYLSTAMALAEVAKKSGARVLAITAQPEGPIAAVADGLCVIPAQTMATDRGENTSILPMGSVFEGALFLLFELITLKLKLGLNVSSETMRANHTNLE